ncbi:peptidoglycan-binding protein [Inquilinus sp. YAF38]|uniref:peptidoglycan-binding protein n=1 Tax=Inquilinus sp. YAF38 TaxID=3233084 RepID=UPI003F8FCF43
MKSLADDGTSLEREPNPMRRGAARHAAAVLLGLTLVGCSTLNDLGLGWGDTASAEAPQEAATIITPQAMPAVSAPVVRVAAPSPQIPDGDPAAQLQLPDNASPELRDLARKAIAGDANAEYEIGTVFAQGVGVPQNYEHAAYWYRRAADRGKADAAYAFGFLWEQGLGVPRDAREAMTWFRKASVTGNPRGAYEVGRLYEAGELGPPNPVMAAGWYRIAAKAGDEPGKQALARLQAALDAGRLAPAQTAAADESPQQVPDNRAAPAPAGSGQMATVSPPVGTATLPAIAPERPATSAQIREIQLLLGKLNLDAGRANGRLGRKTRAAIATFQGSHALPVTGRPSAALLEALRTAAEPPRFD